MRRRSTLLTKGAAALTATVVVAGAVIWSGSASVHADTVAPPAPANLRVSPAPISTDGTIVLTWDASAASDVAYYQIFRFNGSGAPGVTELTYLGRTDDARNFYMDTAPGEGDFQYAIVAVDEAGNASESSLWASVTVDLPENGVGTITPDLTPPAAPNAVDAGAEYRNDRQIKLKWDASDDTDLWRYLLYRADGAETAKLVTYLEADATQFTDTVNADNRYTYYLLAQDRNGNASASSTVVETVVDTAAPVVQILAPVSGHTYAATGELAITANVAETGAGFSEEGIKFYLNGALLSSDKLNLGNLTSGAHTVRMEVTDRAGNTGTAEAKFHVAATGTEPLAPRDLTAPNYSKSRSVKLTWKAPTSGTLTRYVVHRVGPDGTKAVGTTTASVTSFTDSVSVDGVFSYYVVAENNNTSGPASAVVTVVVDTAAPAIAVTSPEAGARYRQEGAIDINLTVTDSLSGYEAGTAKVYLDGSLFTGDQIDLASLATGDHTLKVVALDRAGNQASKQVQFQVEAIQSDDDDDKDDEDKDKDKDGKGDKPGTSNPELVDLLFSLKSQIHHGQYNALLAKARNGNLRSFESHVVKHRGKHIAPAAADKLLEAVRKLSK